MRMSDADEVGGAPPPVDSSTARACQTAWLPSIYRRGGLAERNHSGVANDTAQLGEERREM